MIESFNYNEGAINSVFLKKMLEECACLQELMPSAAQVVKVSHTSVLISMLRAFLRPHKHVIMWKI